MAEKYKQLHVSDETFEPFVLYLDLGTLKAMKSRVMGNEIS